MAEKYFPLYISMKGRRCLVYGGGQIASRRIGALLRFGAEVWVTAPRVCDAIWKYRLQYPGQCRIVEDIYRPGIVEADFVLACTDVEEVQEEIYRECRSRGILVNLASDQNKCDFFFPALVEQEELVIGVCSGGTDHSRVRRMAQKLRMWLEEQERPPKAGI